MAAVTSKSGFKFGVEVLLESDALKAELKGKRVALLAHPASVDTKLRHSVDLLFSHGIELSSAFGPQHGIRGDKQDNMVETDDEFDPVYKIPVFSLYGKTRRLNSQMLDTFDVILIDLQDIGGRIYTFVTTLLYILEDAGKAGKAVWVLDRPNPAGRKVEGFKLIPGNESFVGAGPLPMRHGLTMGELAHWFVSHYKLPVDYKVVAMQGYNMRKPSGFGWPEEQVAWVNPSPNIPTLNSARCFSGTVLIEGTTLSEGRGTTRALEVVGASDIDIKKVMKEMALLEEGWMAGALLRECFFEPTFHKHQKKLCQALQIHTDWPGYEPEEFHPFRLVTLFLKAVRKISPDYSIWRDFHYEYVEDRLAIDVINGGPALREWVDDPTAVPNDLEELLRIDEISWLKEREEYLIYRD